MTRRWEAEMERQNTEIVLTQVEREVLVIALALALRDTGGDAQSEEEPVEVDLTAWEEPVEV